MCGARTSTHPALPEDNLERSHASTPQQSEAQVNFCQVGVTGDVRADKLGISIPCAVQVVGYEIEPGRCQQDTKPSQTPEIDREQVTSRSACSCIALTSKCCRYQKPVGSVTVSPFDPNACFNSCTSVTKLAVSAGTPPWSSAPGYS